MSDTFLKTLQYLTVGMGMGCMMMSFLLFLHFIRADRPIAKAVAFMLLGESVGAAVTVAFAITAEGVVNIVGPVSALIMRWVMFGAAMVTSIHLAYQTWRVEVSHDDARYYDDGYRESRPGPGSDDDGERDGAD